MMCATCSTDTGSEEMFWCSMACYSTWYEAENFELIMYTNDRTRVRQGVQTCYEW